MLFADAAGSAPLKPQPFASKANLRRFAREMPVDAWMVERIDARTVDEQNRPVVEFKRTAMGSTIGQALVYLNLVLGHKDAVALKVSRKLGLDVVDRLDWSRSRLMCVGEDIPQRQKLVTRQVSAKVELVHIVCYGCRPFLIQRECRPLLTLDRYRRTAPGMSDTKTKVHKISPSGAASDKAVTFASQHSSTCPAPLIALCLFRSRGVL